MKKRVLIVNAHFDDARRPSRRPTTVLRAMGPPFLAGTLDPRSCEVRLHDEQTAGPLEDRAALGWPDLLVLTGLTNAFDRMLHLTAYARTLAPGVVVAAGGPAVRALPRHSARCFDYACQGDVEELAAVADDAFGRGHGNPDEPLPRFDLAPWIGSVGHVESSRACNFHCTFCSLTGEGRPYRAYPIDYVRRQIETSGPRRLLVFVDNNFAGCTRAELLARFDLLTELRARGYFKGWGALVTSDFFFDDEVVRAAAASGCRALFCGIESFDQQTLLAYRKRQNVRLPQVEIFRRALDAGILLVYGVILDPSSRSLAEISAELDLIARHEELAMPSIYTLTIPYPRTPFFRDCAARGRLLPNTRLCDLDGKTLSVRPIDPADRVAEFVRDLQTLRGRRCRTIAHFWRFARRYRRSLSPAQLAVQAAREAALAGVFQAPGRWAGALAGRPRRTHVSGTDSLDPSYRPAFPVAARFEGSFRPTRLTEADGSLSPALAEDLAV